MEKGRHFSLFLCVWGIGLCPCPIVTGLETEELEENWLSDASSGNKTELEGKKAFVEISAHRRDWGMLHLSHSELATVSQKRLSASSLTLSAN